MSIQLSEIERKWLEEHKHELPPEEIKEENYNIGEWPIPIEIPNLGIFCDINSQKDFNRIIGDINNWAEIKNRSDLYEKWIIPQAIILFGKGWFDRVKWKKSIHRGAPFPLFGEEDKRYASDNKIRLEDTIAGKAIIAKIIDKTAYALDVYLEGKWLSNSVSITKKPGGYIIDSLKNEFIRSIGTDLGYKLSSVFACPYCLSNKNINKKTPLIHNGSNQYTCPKCRDLSKSIEKITQDDIQNRFIGAKKFINFIGISCICPSETCPGHFVPINCIDFDDWKITKNEFVEKINSIGKEIKKLSVPKNIHNFVYPPKNILDLNLKCPFCCTKFSIESAIKSKSGFKGKSGMLTGLPTITIWEKKCSASLDQNINEDTEISQKDSIAGNFFNLEDHILSKQKINVLIDELIIHMSKLNTKQVSGLLTWYFYMAAIIWMSNYYTDASKYFFDCKHKERELTEKEKIMYPGENKKNMTLISRGQEISIHQALFYCWMDLLDKNIDQFIKISSKIKSVKDFGWLCHAPKFIGGPLSTFYSTVNSNMKIENRASISCSIPQKFSPRIARVISINKIKDKKVEDKNCIDDIKCYEWQAIHLKEESCFKPGDVVKVSVLLMPGHTTHAPIQRIIRLRTMVLSQIINRIKQEELNNTRDINFWQNRKKMVQKARELTNIDFIIKE